MLDRCLLAEISLHLIHVAVSVKRKGIMALKDRKLENTTNLIFDRSLITKIEDEDLITHKNAGGTSDFR